MPDLTQYDNADERYWECVKDLNPTLHVGGFPARAIVIELADGHFVLYKADLRPDRAFSLMRSLAKNDERKWVRIHSVNQKTKSRVDTVHRQKA